MNTFTIQYVLRVAFYRVLFVYIVYINTNRQANGVIWVCVWATQLAEENSSIIILAVSKVDCYVSDRLEFHHPGSGTQGQG